MRPEVFRCCRVRVARIAFQACAIDHSAISPFRINHLRILDRAESDLCPDCALTLSASPHILIRIIDFDFDFAAIDKVVFRDTKEGTFAMRVATVLEEPAARAKAGGPREREDC